MWLVSTHDSTLWKSTCKDKNLSWDLSQWTVFCHSYIIVVMQLQAGPVLVTLPLWYRCRNFNICYLRFGGCFHKFVGKSETLEINIKQTWMLYWKIQIIVSWLKSLLFTGESQISVSFNPFLWTYRHIRVVGRSKQATITVVAPHLSYHVEQHLMYIKNLTF